MKDSKVFVVNVSDEPREIEVYVNGDGDLVLSGVGSVIYEMYDDVLVLMKGKE